jgi:hypothetical protein
MKIPMLKFVKVEIGRRMANWGHAQAGGGSFTAPGFSMFASNDVREGPSIPILFGEADETDRVLRVLREAQRRVLELQYVHQPPVHERHRSLGLTNGAYYRLVESAHQDFWAKLKHLRAK